MHWDALTKWNLKTNQIQKWNYHNISHTVILIINLILQYFFLKQSQCSAFYLGMEKRRSQSSKFMHVLTHLQNVPKVFSMGYFMTIQLCYLFSRLTEKWQVQSKSNECCSSQSSRKCQFNKVYDIAVTAYTNRHFYNLNPLQCPMQWHLSAGACSRCSVARPDCLTSCSDVNY